MRNPARKTWIGLIVSLGVMFQLVAASSAWSDENTTSADKWQFEITPYFLAAAMVGTSGARGVTADVDMSFEDIWNNLDAGFMVAGEARKGPWILAAEGIYFRLNTQETKSWQGPGGRVSVRGEVDATLTETIFQFSGGYRAVDHTTKLDIIGAARYTRVENDLTLVTSSTGQLFPGGTRNISGSAEWWDPVIGARVLQSLSEKWSLFGYGDIGGFGIGSDITYQLMGGIRYQFTKLLSAKLAYRALYQDYEKDGVVWDMTAHGPLLGLGFSF